MFLHIDIVQPKDISRKVLQISSCKLCMREKKTYINTSTFSLFYCKINNFKTGSRESPFRGLQRGGVIYFASQLSENNLAITFHAKQD